MSNFDNISKQDLNLLKSKYDDLNPIIEKINNNYPVQYLIGYVDFYGYQINVNEDVLIPRYETEFLVDKTIQYIKKYNFDSSRVLDIGTGSGCISIVLKKEIPSLEITGLDISDKALEIARENAKINDADVSFINDDIFNYNSNTKYDIIVSNPPYIPDGAITDPKTDYEPKIAIYTEGDPLRYYMEIFKLSKKILNKRYLLAFEIDEDESSNLYNMAKEYFKDDLIVIEKDLANKDRYLFIISD